MSVRSALAQANTLQRAREAIEAEFGRLTDLSSSLDSLTRVYEEVLTEDGKLSSKLLEGNYNPGASENATLATSALQRLIADKGSLRDVLQEEFTCSRYRRSQGDKTKDANRYTAKNLTKYIEDIEASHNIMNTMDALANGKSDNWYTNYQSAQKTLASEHEGWDVLGLTRFIMDLGFLSRMDPGQRYNSNQLNDPHKTMEGIGPDEFIKILKINDTESLIDRCNNVKAMDAMGKWVNYFGNDEVPGSRHDDVYRDLRKLLNDSDHGDLDHVLKTVFSEGLKQYNYLMANSKEGVEYMMKHSFLKGTLDNFLVLAMGENPDGTVRDVASYIVTSPYMLGRYIARKNLFVREAQLSQAGDNYFIFARVNPDAHTNAPFGEKDLFVIHYPTWDKTKQNEFDEVTSLAESIAMAESNLHAKLTNAQGGSGEVVSAQLQDDRLKTKMYEEKGWIAKSIVPWAAVPALIVYGIFESLWGTGAIGAALGTYGYSRGKNARTQEVSGSVNGIIGPVDADEHPMFRVFASKWGSPLREERLYDKFGGE